MECILEQIKGLRRQVQDCKRTGDLETAKEVQEYIDQLEQDIINNGNQQTSIHF